MIALGKCNVISLNVRGLRNRVKRRSIFCFLKDQNCDVFFLQEMYSEPNDENTWQSEWGGDMFFSHGSIHSRGVCILLNPSMNCIVKKHSQGPNWKNHLDRFEFQCKEFLFLQCLCPK